MHFSQSKRHRRIDVRLYSAKNLKGNIPRHQNVPKSILVNAEPEPMLVGNCACVICPAKSVKAKTTTPVCVLTDVTGAVESPIAVQFPFVLAGRAVRTRSEEH